MCAQVCGFTHMHTHLHPDTHTHTHPYVVCQEGNIKETLAAGMRSLETSEGLRSEDWPAEAAGKSIGHREPGQ